MVKWVRSEQPVSNIGALKGGVYEGGKKVVEIGKPFEKKGEEMIARVWEDRGHKVYDFVHEMQLTRDYSGKKGALLLTNGSGTLTTVLGKKLWERVYNILTTFHKVDMEERGIAEAPHEFITGIARIYKREMEELKGSADYTDAPGVKTRQLMGLINKIEKKILGLP